MSGRRPPDGSTPSLPAPPTPTAPTDTGPPLTPPAVSRCLHAAGQALLRDLYSACNYKPWADPLPASERKRLKAACRKAAEKYYGAVSAAG
ncbi:hypothetical protein ACIQVT_15840 [Streptomyces sp. NPDC100445]|uniref:hypothetical protein n=1 Tax=Streptomyces sp. NPDC100445 TaxID=3366102 RepID=UPI00381BA874